MLPAMIARFLVALLIGLAIGAAPAHAQGRRARTVVELYTSQGCSQCPRANRLLGQLSHEDNVLALTFSVGIWDYLGWRDTLAQPEFAGRQQAFSRALRVRGRFTPQLVFNGASQISAASWDDARDAFDAEQRAGWPPGAPEVAITRINNGRARVTLTGNAHRSPPADVWMVAYDPGPITVYVRGGLNIDRSITHYNLVRSIDRVGVWEGNAVWYERARCSPECAVLVQEPNGGRILAAAYTSRPRR